MINNDEKLYSLNEIFSFRKILTKIYEEQPYNDEGNRCDPSTVYEVTIEWNKWFENLRDNAK